MNAYQSDKIKETSTSVYAYDLAIVNDLRTRFNLKSSDGTPKTNNKVYVTAVDNVFDIIGDLSEDRIDMPIVSLQRLGWSVADYHPQFMTFSGHIIGQNEENKIIRLQAIPIRVNYQMDIWTKDRITNDAIIRELLFYYTLRPTLLVNIPYSLDITHNFNIFFDPDIEDNSDIIEHDNRGIFFRQTLGLYTDDAYLWKSSKKDPIIIESADFLLYDGVIKDNKLIEETDMKNLVKGDEDDVKNS